MRFHPGLRERPDELEAQFREAGVGVERLVARARDVPAASAAGSRLTMITPSRNSGHSIPVPNGARVETHRGTGRGWRE